jgi:cytochrome c55X
MPSLPIAFPRVALMALALASSPAFGASTADIAALDARVASGWRAVRTVDCARCHGKTYDGWAAPSIVRYAATQERDSFVRMVLDGDPPRGMPGYRSNGYVAERIDDIYQYFLARANGEIGPDYREP